MPDLVFATKGQAEALRAQQAMVDAAKKQQAEMKALAAESEKAKKAILAIYESTKTPQEQMKQRMEVLRKAIKDGTAPPEAITALERLKAKYQETFSAVKRDISTSTLSAKELEAANKKALDLGRTKEWGAGLAAAAAGPLAALVAGFKQLADYRDDLAEKDKAAISGEGGLSQFVSPTQSAAALLAESRAAYAGGIGSDRTASANALGSMLGAGIDKPADRLLLMKMQSTGLIENAGEVAKSAKTLQSTYGGDLMSMLDRAFGAGDIAPGGASQLMIASSRSAQRANKLGISADEVVGATAALGQSTGSEDIGATQLASLLKGLRNAGGYEGLGLSGALQKLKADAASIDPKTGKAIGVRGIIGDRSEAMDAYDFLTSKLGGATYSRGFSGAAMGAATKASLQMLSASESDPNSKAARFAIQQSRQREVASLDEAAIQNVLAGLQSERARNVDSYPTALRVPLQMFGDTLGYLERAGNAESYAREYAQPTPIFGTDSPAKVEARKTIQAIDEQRKVQEEQRKLQERMAKALESLDNKSNEGGLIISGE